MDKFFESSLLIAVQIFQILADFVLKLVNLLQVGN